MARPPRLEVPGAVYHVTARGNERRAIFRDDADREEYLARVALNRKRSGFHLLAYCLMPNHVHLAIRTGPDPLSRVMARIHSTYAAWFNRRHARAGHLFQGRYKAFLVQEDRYLHALVRYIHRNPVEARLARSAGDFPWSSDRFLRRGKGPDWLDVDPLLALLDGSRRAAVGRYIALVDGPPTAPAYDRCAAAAHVVVGDEAFALAQLQATVEPDAPLRGIDPESLLAIVARECGLTLEEIAGRRCGGEIAAARCRAAYLARHVCHIPLSRLTRRLGRDDSSLARPLAALEARMKIDPPLYARILRLIDTLRAHRPKSENQV